MPEAVPIPSDPGPGYVFSGERHRHFRGNGGRVREQPRRPRHRPGRHGRHHVRLVAVSLQVIDNLYLPGLGRQSSIVIPPISAKGHQVISRMGAGVLRIDGALATLSCTGPGVNDDASLAGATVIVVPGTTVSVACTREADTTSST